MKLVKADWRNLKTYKRTKLDEVLDEFLAMNTECVEVADHNYSNEECCYNTLCNAIKRRNMRSTIGVRMCNGKVYLINKVLTDKEA